MAYIEFDDSLRVGNRVIDQEHEMLISYINLLQKAVENKASSGIVEKVVDGLVDYTKTHFFVEEELMKAYAYPDMDSHMLAHEKFRQQANALVESLAKGEAVDLPAVLAFLKQWLTAHILKIDARFADFLKDKSMS